MADGASNSRASKNLIYRHLKKWRYVSAKLKGADGETDYNTKTIKINKSRSKKYIPNSGISKGDSTIINTLVHERLHKNHPRMLEKTVRVKARKLVKHMGKKSKGRLYSKIYA